MHKLHLFLTKELVQIMLYPHQVQKNNRPSDYRVKNRSKETVSNAWLSERKKLSLLQHCNNTLRKLSFEDPRPELPEQEIDSYFNKLQQTASLDRSDTFSIGSGYAAFKQDAKISGYKFNLKVTSLSDYIHLHRIVAPYLESLGISYKLPIVKDIMVHHLDTYKTEPERLVRGSMVVYPKSKKQFLEVTKTLDGLIDKAGLNLKLPCKAEGYYSVPGKSNRLQSRYEFNQFGDYESNYPGREPFGCKENPFTKSYAHIIKTSTGEPVEWLSTPEGNKDIGSTLQGQSINFGVSAKNEMEMAVWESNEYQSTLKTDEQFPRTKFKGTIHLANAKTPNHETAISILADCLSMDSKQQVDSFMNQIHSLNPKSRQIQLEIASGYMKTILHLHESGFKVVANHSEAAGRITKELERLQATPRPWPSEISAFWSSLMKVRLIKPLI